MNNLRKLLVALILLLPGVPATAAESPEAVVFMYHRFGEGKYPATNTRLDQLDAQIAYLKDNGFAVLPLPRIVDAILGNTPLPPKAVAITVDDAYASVLSEAHPRFMRAGFPYTVFVATEAVASGNAGIMSWDDIRKLRADGVTIGAHGHAHAHFPALSGEAMRADVIAMKEAFTRELGAVPELFAYPYGEAGRADMESVKGMGFKAAFGQHSGVLYAEADKFYLPRFALNENFGGMERFALAANARALRVTDFVPVDPVLRVHPPEISFDVLSPPPGLTALGCFDAAGTPLPLTVDGARVRLAPEAFKPGRVRVNCTLKSNGAWYWYGHQLIAGGVSEGVAVDARYKP